MYVYTYIYIHTYIWYMVQGPKYLIIRYVGVATVIQIPGKFIAAGYLDLWGKLGFRFTKRASIRI